MSNGLFARALVACLALAFISSAGLAKTLRYAPESDALTLDPHGALVARTQAVQGWIYEGLTRFDNEMNCENALAESRARIAPDTWRFKLRQGVRFHDGAMLTADDVVFSVERALSARSAVRVLFASIKAARKVDDATVDIVTHAPNPILDRELTMLFVLSKDWAERNGAVQVANLREGEGFATRNANGTGPFVMRSREAGHRSVLARNPQWWGSFEGNVSEIVMTPIANDATRVAALLSGAVDLVEPVPVQSVAQVDEAAGFDVITRPEQRVIFLGLDVARDELAGSGVNGRNPLKDVRVRRALYHAIDVEAIRTQVMRGLATPRATLLVPGVDGYDPALDQRYAFDVATSRALLAEAGYPGGFDIALDCPGDRFVADEQICQAVAAMLSQAGIKASPIVQPSARFFPKLMARQTSLFLAGWLIATGDAFNPISALLVSPGPGVGAQNIGGYANPRLDQLARTIAVEGDPVLRKAQIAEVMRIYKDDVIHIPLHQQWIAWGVRANVEAVAPPDNLMRPHWISIH
jgi:peptide/nickel transport system substrate-binding protein